MYIGGLQVRTRLNHHVNKYIIYYLIPGDVNGKKYTYLTDKDTEPNLDDIIRGYESLEDIIC